MIWISWAMFVLLLFGVVAVGSTNSKGNLIRRRRHWVIPPKSLHENTNYTHLESIARIRSDYDTGSNIVYSLEGVGANKNPFHLFVVDHQTGDIRVTKILDREYISMYNLSGVATYLNGSLAEKNIDIRVKVIDENDNPPVFQIMKPGNVTELSAVDTSVMKVVATDADEPGNPNSMISYTIIEQIPDHGMFYMNKDGTIYVRQSSLDREKEDQYILKVRGQDLNGQPGGNTGTGTVTINVNDVNDNPPTLEKEMYEGNIEENTYGVEVMRLKAEDLDLKDTENWEAVYEIINGNEAGYFSIKTDPKTNEGILMLDKAVDYEDMKNLDLELIVKNKAPAFGYDATGAAIGIGIGGAAGGAFGAGGAGGAGGGGGGGGGGGTSGTWSTSGATGATSTTGVSYKTYPIKINVKNQPEGPRFDPKVKAIPISEGVSETTLTKEIIASYPAIDGDTLKPAENVRYVKGSDPDNWLTIDPLTADIRLNKIPDRESPALVNGTYFAQVLCISEDEPDKTATGTIAIQVEDFNDHCPILTSDAHTLCTTKTSVIVNAIDGDAFPNGSPFEFIIIPEGTEGKWEVEHLNDTAAILRTHDSMWPGLYQVELQVRDQQGVACPEPQKVKVQVCTCEDGVMCGKRGANGQPSKESVLGPAGIGLLLLGLLLLLLIPLLLLFCQCGGAAGFPDLFTEMPYDTKSHLINYHTERQGENTEVPLMNIPTQVDGGDVKMGVEQNFSGAADFPQLPMNGMNETTYVDGLSSIYRDRIWEMNQQNGTGIYSEFEGRQTGGDGGIFDGMALPAHFLGQYYNQVTSKNDNLGVKDGLLVYDYEGQGSSAGSAGCCSLPESENDLQFLDDLGPKFKTLAEVCGGKMIPSEVKVKPAFAPLPSASTTNVQTSVSTLMTAQQKPPPPQLQPIIPKVEETVVRETTEHSKKVKKNTATVRNDVTTVITENANQNQMVLVPQQQPVYYTTTPVLQPVRYVVQPQVQNTVLLAEAPATNLQSMVLVNDAQSVPSQGVFVQGQTVMSSGQAQGPGVVLVENSGVQGTNVIHTGNLSGPQTMMVVEGKIPAGSMRVVKGGQTCLVQGGTLQPGVSQTRLVQGGTLQPGVSQTRLVQGGTLQRGGLSGSQTVLVVGEPTSSGRRLVQEAGVLSQKSEVSGIQRDLQGKGNTSTGSQSRKMGYSTTTVSAAPNYRKVVVEETREIH